MKNNVGRYLVVYDGTTEEVEELIALESMDLSFLKNLLDVPPNDPEMHDKYGVGPDEIEKILSFATKKIDYDFSRYAYFVEAITKD